MQIERIKGGQMKTYSAKTIAYTIINYCVDNEFDITNLRLHKFLYFVYGYAKFSFQSFSADIVFQAWPYGPVNAEIYNEFKCYGIGSIPRQRISTYSNNISEKDVEIIYTILSALVCYPTAVLIDQSYSHSAWKDAYAIDKGTIMCDQKISEAFPIYLPNA